MGNHQQNEFHNERKDIVNIFVMNIFLNITGYGKS
jgi:hypothetical protein